MSVAILESNTSVAGEHRGCSKLRVVSTHGAANHGSGQQFLAAVLSITERYFDVDVGDRHPADLE
jgi:hypothetical protein